MFAFRSLLTKTVSVDTPLNRQTRNVSSYFHRGVKFLFKKNLLMTNSITSGLFMFIGDMVQQEFEYSSNILSKRYDWERSGRMFIIGTAMGPLHHYYYLKLDVLMPKCDIKTVMKKVLCDQTIASPLTILFFFYGMGYLEHKSVAESTQEIKKKLLYVYGEHYFSHQGSFIFLVWSVSQPHNKFLNSETVRMLGVAHGLLFIGDCIFWPPIQIINFYYLPSMYRVVYINLATMVFNVFMSFMKHYDQQPTGS